MSNIMGKAFNALGIGGAGCISGVKSDLVGDGGSLEGKKITHLPSHVSKNLKAEVLILGNMYSAAMAIKDLATGTLGLFATVFTGSYAYKKSETIKSWTNNIWKVVPDVLQIIPLVGNWIAAWRNKSDSQKEMFQGTEDAPHEQPVDQEDADTTQTGGGSENETNTETDSGNPKQSYTKPKPIATVTSKPPVASKPAAASKPAEQTAETPKTPEASQPAAETPTPPVATKPAEPPVATKPAEPPVATKPAEASQPAAETPTPPVATKPAEAPKRDQATVVSQLTKDKQKIETQVATMQIEDLVNSVISLIKSKDEFSSINKHFIENAIERIKNSGDLEQLKEIQRYIENIGPFNKNLIDIDYLKDLILEINLEEAVASQPAEPTAVAPTETEVTQPAQTQTEQPSLEKIKNHVAGMKIQTVVERVINHLTSNKTLSDTNKLFIKEAIKRITKDNLQKLTEILDSIKDKKEIDNDRQKLIDIMELERDKFFIQANKVKKEHISSLTNEEFVNCVISWLKEEKPSNSTINALTLAIERIQQTSFKEIGLLQNILDQVVRNEKSQTFLFRRAIVNKIADLKIEQSIENSVIEEEREAMSRTDKFNAYSILEKQDILNRAKLLSENYSNVLTAQKNFKTHAATTRSTFWNILSPANKSDWEKKAETLKEQLNTSYLEFVENLSDPEIRELGRKCDKDGNCCGITRQIDSVTFNPLIPKDVLYNYIKNRENSSGNDLSNLFPVKPGFYWDDQLEEEVSLEREPRKQAALNASRAYIEHDESKPGDIAKGNELYGQYTQLVKKYIEAMTNQELRNIQSKGKLNQSGKSFTHPDFAFLDFNQNDINTEITKRQKNLNKQIENIKDLIAKEFTSASNTDTHVISPFLANHLKGAQKEYLHSLSPEQLEALSSNCDKDGFCFGTVFGESVKFHRDIIQEVLSERNLTTTVADSGFLWDSIAKQQVGLEQESKRQIALAALKAKTDHIASPPPEKGVLSRLFGSNTNEFAEKLSSLNKDYDEAVKEYLKTLHPTVLQKISTKTPMELSDNVLNEGLIIPREFILAEGLQRKELEEQENGGETPALTAETTQMLAELEVAEEVAGEVAGEVAEKVEEEELEEVAEEVAEEVEEEEVEEAELEEVAEKVEENKNSGDFGVVVQDETDVEGTDQQLQQDSEQQQ